MVTVSILPIREYCCTADKASESSTASYSIPQLVALCKNNKVAKIKMREYLNEIKDTGNYLVKILEVLSMLSNEYHFPVDKMYLGEKNLFNKVQIYISNNLINKDTFFPKILEKKYEDVNNLYRKRIIELKQNRKLDDSVSQIIDAELIDIYKNTINEYVDIYYQEIKKYIKIEKKGLFVLDSN